MRFGGSSAGVGFLAVTGVGAAAGAAAAADARPIHTALPSSAAAVMEFYNASLGLRLMG